MSSSIVERSSRRKPGSFCEAAPRGRRCRSAVACADGRRSVLMNPATLSRSRASGGHHRVAVAWRGRASSWFCWRGSPSTWLVSRSAGLERSTISASSSPRAARPGAEVVEDEPEAVRIRLAHDVVDEVEVDRLAVSLERQQVLAGARLSVGDRRQLGRRLACPAARGSVGLHSTNFSPISDCGRIRHEASVRKSWNAGVVDLAARRPPCRASGLPSSMRGLVLAGDVDVGDRADLGAGDPDVLAGDQEARVVEDRPDLVLAAVAAGAGRR